MSAGQLVLIATPIGNLGDIAPRAVEQLRACDRVLAEDTRRARALLSHLGIGGKPIDRLDAKVESRGVSRWVERLASGETIALVSDAGTPSVSDPGADLVRAAADEGIVVVPVPGPCAVTAALAASGLGGGPFRFVGFLPRGGPSRREALQQVVATPEVVILFEAPSRIGQTLRDLAERMPSRDVVVAREISKVHEEFLRGELKTLVETLSDKRWQGELTVVLGSYGAERASMTEDEIEQRIDTLVAEGMRVRDIAKALALETGLAASDIYRRVSERKSR